MIYGNIGGVIEFKATEHSLVGFTLIIGRGDDQGAVVLWLGVTQKRFKKYNDADIDQGCYEQDFQ